MSLFIELQSQMTVIDSIIKEMRGAIKNDQKINSHLILGNAGVGKTTLIKLLMEKIEHDPQLKEVYNLIFVPTSFHGIDSFQEIERLIEQVEVNKLKKHQVLFIDDLDLMIEQSEKNAHSLRELLIRDEPRIALVTTARSLFFDKIGHDKALYGFFSLHTLKGAIDQDVFSLLGGMLGTPQWHKLNETLALTNPFWVVAIADDNPRLLSILTNVFHALNSRNKEIDPEQFLISFFELAEPSFKTEMMELPRYSRYFLEEACMCSHFFKIKDIPSLNITNRSREAIKLVNLGYLKKNDEGEYSFTQRPLKAWLRYMRQVPLGKVLNVDVVV